MTRSLPLARALSVIALLVATCAPLRAQLASGVLRLTVTDSTSLALPASGTLSSVSAQTHRDFETDAEGRFTFDRLLPGVYRLTVSRPGFAPRTDLVEIQSELPREIHITLDVAPLSASVVVTGEATLVDRRRPGVVYVVGAQQVREQQSAVPGRELLDLVNLQPGWLLEANGVLHPRGSEYQTLFVVDGVPMEDNRSPVFAPVLPDPEVETVNVLTGTFPAEYGRKLGGVVDVTTSREIRRGFHGSIEAGVGSFGAGAGFASGGYGWAHRLLTMSAGLSRTDRYLDPPTSANGSNHGSLGNAAIAFEQDPTGTDRIRLTLRNAHSSFRVPNDLVQQDAGQRQDRSSGETSASAAWSRVFSSALVNVRAVGTDLSARLSSNALSVPIAAFQQRGFRRGYLSANVTAQAGPHEFKVGGDVLHARVNEALQYHVTDRSFFDRSTPIDFAFSDNQPDREQALFAQDTIRVGDLTLSVGLRWDRYRFLVDDSALSPRLGAAWSPSSDLVVRFSYDRAFLTPAMENLLQKDPEVSVVYTINEPAAAGAYEALKSVGRDKDVLIVSVDGGCPGVRNVADGVIGATSMQFPLLMASKGVEAVKAFADTGAKPQATPGLDFVNTGVELVTDKPVTGIKSIPSSEALKKCWG